jgi:uncharacterized Fe-S radical SAM superfamily protein PflX
MANDHIADDRKKVRLIDANEVYELHSNYPMFARSCADLTDLRDILDEAKTVDAVEVVRCKDCVNYCGFERCKNGICDVDSVSKRAVYPDDFCSYGERRAEDDHHRTE